jgi:flagellum-specific peptidoglycan hydrolase FlgJ
MTPAQIDQQIYLMALANGYTDLSARLIVAQARLESADYTSNVYKNNLNAYGMKFVGQALATRGTLAPKSERTKDCIEKNICTNINFYAKYQNASDSAKDVIVRLYGKTLKGITPAQLKNAKSPIEFATLLKQRAYFGVTATQYANGLSSKLKKIKIQPVQTLPAVTITAEKKNNLIYYIIAGAIAFFIFGKLKKTK